MQAITAKVIVELLRKKHDEDVFFTEVVIDHGRRRMDAWAMKKSWASPLVVAYEIKISRSDFVADSAIPDYMQYCNEMYVVAPKGVIQVYEELPEGCGYIEVSKNGARLFTKKKAQYRECVLSEQFLRSILMSKADNIFSLMSNGDAEMIGRINSYRTYKNYAEGKLDLKNIGYSVGYKYATIERENERLKKEIATYEDVKDWMERFKNVFGSSASYYLERGKKYEDDVIESVNKRLEVLNNPERIIIEKVNNFKKHLDDFIEKMGGKI